MKVITYAALIGLSAATGSAAMAADLSRVFVPSSPTLRDYRGDNSRGWYLRGTVSYVVYKRPEADFTAPPLTGNLTRESLQQTAAVGGGLGYRFNPNVRTDITVDHFFNAGFKGYGPAPDPATASIMDRGQFQSTAYMLNGYLDFKSAMGFTPYVGAGIGVAHNTFSQHVLTTFDPTTGLETSERFAGGDKFDLAWALMAGVGYQMSSNFTLDLGYRYISLGDVKTRSYDDGTGVKVDSIGAHEVRLGVRYSFN